MLSHKRTLIFAIVLIATAIVSLTLLPIAAAGPLPPSIGCNMINYPFLDGQATYFGTSPALFNEGEIITLTSDNPSGSGTAPYQIELRNYGSSLATTSFPGTITYTIPASGSYRLIWFITPQSVNTTWTAECTVAN